MAIVVIDTTTLSTIGTLPDNFYIADHSFSQRSDVMPFPYAPGGAVISDGMPGIRQIVLAGRIVGSNVSTTGRDAILGYLLGENRGLRIGNRYIRIARVAQCVESIPRGQWNRNRSIDIPLICTDPFWYSTTESEDEETVSADSLSTPHEWNIENAGAGFWSMISVEIESTVNNYTLKLANNTDGNTGFLYEDNGNASGSVVTVDGTDCTVVRGSTDKLSALTGNFIRLRPGTNAMKYWGKEAVITTTWRQRWL